MSLVEKARYRWNSVCNVLPFVFIKNKGMGDMCFYVLCIPEVIGTGCMGNWQEKLPFGLGAGQLIFSIPFLCLNCLSCALITSIIKF